MAVHINYTQFIFNLGHHKSAAVLECQTNRQLRWYTCRGLVLEALEEHPQWRTICPVQNQDKGCSDAVEYYVPSADAAASQFVWAEYERLDWERIYAGERKLHDMPQASV